MGLQSLLTDIIFYILFMVALYSVIFIGRTDNAFHSKEVIKHILVTADYTQSIPLTRVRTYEQFIEYINETLIPSLLTETKEGRKVPDEPKYRIDELENAENKGDSLYTRLIELGWTIDDKLKLIGPVRFRQIRVRNGTCNIHSAVEKSLRQHDCFSDLTWFNEDTENYSTGWQVIEADEPKVGGTELLPWQYQSSSNAGGMPINGRKTSYSGGGYTLNFGRTKQGAHIILDFMTYFGWIDARTRAIFIEFTSYSVDANIFNVVTLIVEVTAAGAFIPSYKIQSIRFLHQYNEIFVMSLVMMSVLMLFLLIFGFRETLRMKRVSIKNYCSNGWAILDFSILLLGVVNLIIFFAKTYYIQKLMLTLEEAAHKNYISFQYAALLDQISTTLGALLVCLATMKAYRLLTFKALFHQYEKVLKYAGSAFLGLTLLAFCLVLAYSTFFHLVMSSFDERFNTFWRTVAFLVAQKTHSFKNVEDKLFEHAPPIVGPLIFFSFSILMGLLIFYYYFAILYVSVRAVFARPVQSRSRLKPYLNWIVRRRGTFPLNPPPPPNPHITLTERDEYKINSVRVSEIRMEGMKRIALETLTGRSYMEETARKIAKIVLSGNLTATNQNYIVHRQGIEFAISETTIRKMKDVAEEVMLQRNKELSEELRKD